MANEDRKTQLPADRVVQDAPQAERELVGDVRVAPEEGDLPRLPQEALNDERFVYRWVRVELGGEEDMKNILRREREGWRFCRAEDVPGFNRLPLRSVGYTRGTVGVNDVALARLPREIAMARKAMVEKRATELMQAVNSQLLRDNDPRMPIFNESKSTVRVGRNAEFDTT